MRKSAHARRIANGLDEHVRADLEEDPRTAIETHFGFTVQAARSFAQRGAGGWCDGMSETRTGVLLYRATPGRRENFTLAHELAHHLLDLDYDAPSWIADQPDPARLVEEVCDEIASRLLIPEERIRWAIGDAKPSAATIAELYETTTASRTACMIAVASRLPCDGFALLVDPDDPTRVFTASRARETTRPYAWKGNEIPGAHPLHRSVPSSACRGWWADWRGDRREYYMSTADVAGYLCAVLVENDLWQVDVLHTYVEVDEDRGNDAALSCPGCGFTGTTRWWPCSTCGVLPCPRCQKCECDRRERREKRDSCQSCLVSVRSHLLVDGLCDDCR